ncbi:hypothetical protein HS125_01165 [bacterium]|nr:hypothetical protein [bacterium]
MSTSEVRQLAAKVARSILPYNAGCKQAAIRRAMPEFNEEYRRLVGEEKYLEVRDEYLRNLYQSLGLKYHGVDENGEAKAEETEGGSEVEALKQRIRDSLEQSRKQREVAVREQRRLAMKATHVEREIANLPPFWFNALIILLLGGAFDGVLFKAASSRLWPLVFLVVGIVAGITVGILDYIKFRRNVERLQRKAAELTRLAEAEAAKVKQLDEQLVRREAEFDLLCTLLSRSFDLSQYTAAPPEAAPESTPPTPQPQPEQADRPPISKRGVGM